MDACGCGISLQTNNVTIAFKRQLATSLPTMLRTHASSYLSFTDTTVNH